MLVLRDADLDRAAEGAVRACFSSRDSCACRWSGCTSPTRSTTASWTGSSDRVEAMNLERRLRLLGRHGVAGLPAAARHGHRARRGRGRQGATCVTGGKARPDIGPLFYEPTVLTGVTPAMTCFSQETFGPVVSVYRFADEQDAVARANDGSYGLNASIYTRDAARGRRLARQISAARVNINEGYGATFGSIDVADGRHARVGPRSPAGPRGHPPLHRGADRRHPAAAADPAGARDVGGAQRQDPHVALRLLKSSTDRDRATTTTSWSSARVRRLGQSALRLTEKGYRVGVLEAGAGSTSRRTRRRRGT